MEDPEELPRDLDPRHSKQVGAEVLARGALPALPAILTYQMCIPVAYWTASRSAVVLFLSFRQWPGQDVVSPMVTMGTYSLDGARWNADRTWASKGWSHDPIATPCSLRSLGGQAITTDGGLSYPDPEPGCLAAVRTGQAAPTVRQIALIQDDLEDRRPLDSHFGAWVICTERATPFQVNALDEKGDLLDVILGRT